MVNRRFSFAFPFLALLPSVALMIVPGNVPSGVRYETSLTSFVYLCYSIYVMLSVVRLLIGQSSLFWQ